MRQLHITKSAFRMRDDSLPSAAPSFICAAVLDKFESCKDQVALRTRPGNNVMMLAKTQSFSYSR